MDVQDPILLDKIKNPVRKEMLLIIYHQPKRYQELADQFNLKPGSIYHHLKLLEPLVEKKSHGLYAISEIGRRFVESNNLIKQEDKLPEISELAEKEDILFLLWTHNGSKWLLFFIFFITFWLSIYDVSIAGSAIYASRTIPALVIDIVALLSGWGLIYYISTIFSKSEGLKLSIVVRAISMLPATIMGLGLLLLYLQGIVLGQTVNTIIFVISFLFGITVTFSGIYYLFERPKKLAIISSGILGMVDLLLGIVILVADA